MKEKKLIGEITPNDMKLRNIPYPDKFGDNVEINRYIVKAFGVKMGEYTIEYTTDDQNIKVYAI